jgi:hypothetical protein
MNYMENIIPPRSGLKEIDGLVTEGRGTILNVGGECEMGRGKRKGFDMLFPKTEQNKLDLGIR